ncbi:hypothetical protein LINGRAPRIM_LOCUS839 [Linum grandiflorum]
MSNCNSKSLFHFPFSFPLFVFFVSDQETLKYIGRNPSDNFGDKRRIGDGADDDDEVTIFLVLIYVDVLLLIVSVDGGDMADSTAVGDQMRGGGTPHQRRRFRRLRRRIQRSQSPSYYLRQECACNIGRWHLHTGTAFTKRKMQRMVNLHSRVKKLGIIWHVSGWMARVIVKQQWEM